MDPITHGDYPYTMRSLVGDRLPKFSCEESQMLYGSFDFIGLNYYTACYAADAPLLRNATPNYSTDSLVNLTGNLISIFHCSYNYYPLHWTFFTLLDLKSSKWRGLKTKLKKYLLFYNVLIDF